MINRIKKFIKELDWLFAGICLLICTPLSIMVWIACDTDNPAFALFGEKIHDWLYGDFK